MNARLKKEGVAIVGGGQLLLLSGSKGDSLGNVAFQTFNSGVEESLFAIGDVGEWVNGFVCSVCLFFRLVFKLLEDPRGNILQVQLEQRRSQDQFLWQLPHHLEHRRGG